MSNFTKQQKIEIFKSFFTGLDNIYGTYDLTTNKVRQVKETVTDKVILLHLTGKQSYGVYLLMGDKTKSLAVDFDHEDIHQPAIFLHMTGKLGVPAYVERSKSKGYHVWIFFESPVSAHKARLVAKKILLDMGKFDTEIFPKQDLLDSNVSYGNFINAPLFGKLVPKGRTAFADPNMLTRSHPDQWQFLNNVKRVSEAKLDAIITNYGLDKDISQTKSSNHNGSIADEYAGCSFGLPPCIRKILSEGVTYDQRVCTFRLAINLKKAGLPLDLATVTLIAWAQKNKPQDNKRIITEKEIKSQAEYAYQKDYRGCGCQEAVIANLCDDRCPLASHKRRTNL
jgi:hypothetical protein